MLVSLLSWILSLSKGFSFGRGVLGGSVYLQCSYGVVFMCQYLIS
jgi:hypothetical protein